MKRPGNRFLIIALLALPVLLLHCSIASAQEGESPEEQAEESPLEPSSAQVFLRIGIGGQKTSTTLDWESNDRERYPLDEIAFNSRGNINSFGLLGWFFPTSARQFMIIADLNVGSVSGKIHYIGRGSDIIGEKFVEYGYASLLGGVGYRFLFGSQDRWAVQLYSEAGVSAVNVTIADFEERIEAAGPEIVMGSGITYRHPFGLVYGGTVDFVGRYAWGQNITIDDANADAQIETFALRFNFILGYEF